MAYSAADALASAMYDSMFDWLVGRVNFAVQVSCVWDSPAGLCVYACRVCGRGGC